MADNHINISIGSSFNGEGFNQLARAAGDVTKTASKVMNSVGQLGNAVGGIDGTIGKVTGSIGNMLGAFAMGGPMGIAIAGVTALVGWIGNIKKEADEAKKKFDEMAHAAEKARIEQMFKDAEIAIANANDALDTHVKKLNEVVTASEKVAKAEKTVADAQKRLTSASDSLEVAQMKSDIQQHMQALSWNPGQQKIAQAQGNVELAQLLGKQNKAEAGKAVEDARERIRDAQRRINLIEQTKTQVQSEIDTLPSKLNDAQRKQQDALDNLRWQRDNAWSDFIRFANKDKDKEAADAMARFDSLNKQVKDKEKSMSEDEVKASQKLTEAKKQLYDLNLRLLQANADEEAASKDLETAKTNHTKACVEAETSEREAKHQLDEMTKAVREEERANLEAYEAEKKAKQLKAEADSKIRDAEIEAAKQLNLNAEASKKLKQAIDDAENAMKNAANGVQWANQHNWGGWGNQEYNPDDFNQFRRAQRYNERANRDANSRKPGQNRVEGWNKREDELMERLGFNKKAWENMTDEEFERVLNSKIGRRLSNADKNWLRDKRNWDNQQNKNKNQKDLDKLQKERNKILENLKDNVKTIKDDLQKALTTK